MLRLAADLYTHRSLIGVRWATEVQKGIVGTKLGFLWLLLDPLLIGAVYYFVVAIIFERGGENFYLFVLIGLWPWVWFSRSISQASSAIYQNRSYVLTTPIPLYVYCIVPVLAHGALAAIGLVLTAFFIPDFEISRVAKVIPFIVLLGTLITALAMLGAVLSSFLRDIAKLVEYGLRLMFFLSPVIYGVERVLGASGLPHSLRELYLWNPLVHLLPSIRDVLLNGNLEVERSHFIIGLVAILIIQLCAMTLRTKKNWIIERL